MIPVAIWYEYHTSEFAVYGSCKNNGDNDRDIAIDNNDNKYSK